MTSFYVFSWLKAFVATFAIEAPIVCSYPACSDAPLPRRLALVLFANLVTHPAVWFIIPELGLPPLWAIVASEVWAIAMEAWFYKSVFVRLTSLRALGISALANGASFGIGLLIRAWTGAI